MKKCLNPLCGIMVQNSYEYCPDCAGGNFEYPEIIAGDFEIVEKCKAMSCKSNENYAMMRKCRACQGTGKIIRPATIFDLLLIVTSRFEDGYYSELNIKFGSKSEGIIRRKCDLYEEEKKK